MNESSGQANRWRWRVLAIIPILFLALGPQLQFCFDRGSNWHGGYATINADEFLYSGYLNALSHGRTRRNDPFTGRIDQAGSPISETAFSIQFVPAYLVSTLSRLTGRSASTAFIFLAGLAAVLAAACIFWLLFSVLGDQRIAAASVLFVLVLGTLVAGQGLIGVLLKLDIVTLGLPFLRRYQPAASFYLFFLFSVLVWHAVVDKNKRRSLLAALAAGITLALMLFSYLYLWTAALAWVAGTICIWFIVKSSDRKRLLTVVPLIAIPFLMALVPYYYLISNRSPTLDELQTLISTRRPDLLRTPEIIGLLILIVLVFSIIRGRAKKDDSRIIFAASFAVLPMLVFNQQIITGRSMQPFHFEAFIINYTTLVGLVIAFGVIYPRISSRSLLSIATLCFLLGAVEVELTRAFYPADVRKDEMVPALRKLDELSSTEGTANSQLVFSPQFELMQMLPTWASQGTLLGIGAIDFGSASHEKRNEFLFTHLYYSGTTDIRLRELLHGVQDELAWSYYVRYVVFGHERVRKSFTLHFRPVTEDEIEGEVRYYSNFVSAFSRTDVEKNPLSYAVVDATGNFDFSHIDNWYERDGGERVGNYVIYRLRLRR